MSLFESWKPKKFKLETPENGLDPDFLKKAEELKPVLDKYKETGKLDRVRRVNEARPETEEEKKVILEHKAKIDAVRKRLGLPPQTMEEYTEELYGTDDVAEPDGQEVGQENLERTLAKVENLGTNLEEEEELLESTQRNITETQQKLDRFSDMEHINDTLEKSEDPQIGKKLREEHDFLRAKLDLLKILETKTLEAIEKVTRRISE